MKEGYWVIRTYEAGSVGEKIKYWVQGSAQRSKRREKTEIRKQEQNEYSAIKQLARLINANFSAGDILLGLDYSEEGMSRLEKYAATISANNGDAAEHMDNIRLAAEREMKLCIRRVKREIGKEGDALRYVAITSDMDGKTGAAVRVHHHLIVPASAKEAFAAKWREIGGVDWSPLTEQDDYTAIAEYFIKQVRRIPDAKKYVTSRNLIRPQPKDRIASTGAEIRVPKGGQLIYRSAFTPGCPQYIRYVLPEGRKRNAPPPLITNERNVA